MSVDYRHSNVCLYEFRVLRQLDVTGLLSYQLLANTSIDRMVSGADVDPKNVLAAILQSEQPTSYWKFAFYNFIYKSVPPITEIMVSTQSIKQMLCDAIRLAITVRHKFYSAANLLSHNDMQCLIYLSFITLYAVTRSPFSTKPLLAQGTSGVEEIGYGFGTFSSRLRYLCRPNMIRRYDQISGKICYYAKTPINAGDALSISWGADETQSAEQRHQTALELHGLRDCFCSFEPQGGVANEQSSMLAQQSKAERELSIPIFLQAKKEPEPEKFEPQPGTSKMDGEQKEQTKLMPEPPLPELPIKSLKFTVRINKPKKTPALSQQDFLKPSSIPSSFEPSSDPHSKVPGVSYNSMDSQPKTAFKPAPVSYSAVTQFLPAKIGSKQAFKQSKTSKLKNLKFEQKNKSKTKSNFWKRSKQFKKSKQNNKAQSKTKAKAEAKPKVPVFVEAPKVKMTTVTLDIGALPHQPKPSVSKTKKAKAPEKIVKEVFTIDESAVIPKMEPPAKILVMKEITITPPGEERQTFQTMISSTPSAKLDWNDSLFQTTPPNSPAPVTQPAILDTIPEVTKESGTEKSSSQSKSKP